MARTHQPTAVEVATAEDASFSRVRSEISRLVTPGFVGFYTHFEIIEIFAFCDSTRLATNVFTILVAEEREDGVSDSATYLGQRIRLKLLEDFFFGVRRTVRPLSEVLSLLETIHTKVWHSSGSSIGLGEMAAAVQQFVPPRLATIEAKRLAQLVNVAAQLRRSTIMAARASAVALGRGADTVSRSRPTGERLEVTPPMRVASLGANPVTASPASRQSPRGAGPREGSRRRRAYQQISFWRVLGMASVHSAAKSSQKTRKFNSDPACPYEKWYILTAHAWAQPVCVTLPRKDPSKLFVCVCMLSDCPCDLVAIVIVVDGGSYCVKALGYKHRCIFDFLAEELDRRWRQTNRRWRAAPFETPLSTEAVRKRADLVV
jgi:hypothetical protein